MAGTCFRVFPSTRRGSLALAIALAWICGAAAQRRKQLSPRNQLHPGWCGRRWKRSSRATIPDARRSCGRPSINRPTTPRRIGSLARSACGTSGSLPPMPSAAQQDKRLAEYARRRDAADANVADQAALARWCRKNHLDDQQRVAWTMVLQLQSDNAEAIKGLGLKPFLGTMATPGQIEQFRARLHKISRGGPLATVRSRSGFRPSNRATP